MNKQRPPFFSYPQNTGEPGKPDERGPRRSDEQRGREAYSVRDEVDPFLGEGDPFGNLFPDDPHADIGFGSGPRSPAEPQAPAAPFAQDEPVPEWLSAPGNPSRSIKAASRQAYEAEARLGPQAGFTDAPGGMREEAPQAEDGNRFGFFTRAAGSAEAPSAEQAPFDLASLDEATLAVLCKERVCPECSVKREADDVLLRAAAELDNSRKRLAREREEQVRFAAESVLSDILPSLDNLDLALQHAGADEACKDVITGVRMTRHLLLESLKKHGLHAVGTVGEVFDPALHEAVGMDPSGEVPKDHISKLLTSGYTLNGRLLRPARVMVAGK